MGFIEFHHSGMCRPLLVPRKTDNLCCVGHFPSRIRETVLVRATCRRKLLELFRLISCWFLRVTWLNTSAFSFYLIPLGLKKLLGKGSHDVSRRGACAISSRSTLGFLSLCCITERPVGGYERLAVDPTPQNDTTDVCHQSSAYTRPIPDIPRLIGRC